MTMLHIATQSKDIHFIDGRHVRSHTPPPTSTNNDGTTKQPWKDTIISIHNRRRRDLLAHKLGQEQIRLRGVDGDKHEGHQSTDDGMSALAPPPPRRRRTPSPRPLLPAKEHRLICNEIPKKSLSTTLVRTKATQPARLQYVYDQYPNRLTSPSPMNNNNNNNNNTSSLLPTRSPIPTPPSSPPSLYDVPVKNTTTQNQKGPRHADDGLMPLLSTSSQQHGTCRRLNKKEEEKVLLHRNQNVPTMRTDKPFFPVTTPRRPSGVKPEQIPPPPRLLLSSPLSHPPPISLSARKNHQVQQQQQQQQYQEEVKQVESLQVPSLPEIHQYQKYNSILTVRKHQGILTRSGSAYFGTENRPTFRPRQTKNTNTPTEKNNTTNTNTNTIHASLGDGDGGGSGTTCTTTTTTSSSSSSSSSNDNKKLSYVMNGMKLIDQHIRKLAKVLEGGCHNLSLNRRGKCYFYVGSFLLNLELATTYSIPLTMSTTTTTTCQNLTTPIITSCMQLNQQERRTRQEGKQQQEQPLQDKKHHHNHYNRQHHYHHTQYHHHHYHHYCYFTLSTTVHWTGIFEEYENDFDSTYLIQSVSKHLHSLQEEQGTYYMLEPKGKSQIVLKRSILISPIYDDFRQDVNHFITIATQIKHDIKHAAHQAEC